jgi:thioredoxin-like negative regulator of GroEL
VSSSPYDQGKQEYETGRWSKAFRYFKESLKDTQRVSEVRILMARCLLGMGEPDKAELELKNVKQLLGDKDKEMLAAFEEAWRLLHDTRRLTPQELEARRRKASENN